MKTGLPYKHMAVTGKMGPKDGQGEFQMNTNHYVDDGLYL